MPIAQLIALVTVLVACVSFHTAAIADDRIVWKDKPEIVTLVPDKERIIVMPAAVEAVDVPPAMAHAVRIQALGDRIFALTVQEFPKTRITVTAGGNVYLLDLKGTKKGRVDPARIIDAVDDVMPDTEDTPSGVIPEVALVRHAAQTLYAPARLIPGQYGDITKTDAKPVRLVYPLVRQQRFSYQFVGQWQGYGLFLSAIQLTNHANERVAIDPRDIRGRWRARSMQHPWVGVAGSTTATTTLYLVSSRPLFDAMPELIPPIEDTEQDKKPKKKKRAKAKVTTKADDTAPTLITDTAEVAVKEVSK